MVVDPEDRDGNLVVSLSQARASGDWLRAQRLMESETILEAAPCELQPGRTDCELRTAARVCAGLPSDRPAAGPG